MGGTIQCGLPTETIHPMLTTPIHWKRVTTVVVLTSLTMDQNVSRQAERQMSWPLLSLASLLSIGSIQCSLLATQSGHSVASLQTVKLWSTCND
jgi:hypothetical protein